MRQTPDHLDRFVRAVHRRMMLLRAAERVGVCLLGGAAVALIVLPLLMYRGRETGGVLLALIGASIAAGVGWAVVRRPGCLAAAAEADRQLKLADLIGTAWAIRGRADLDATFAATVLAHAGARCRAASPAALALHRLGSRGWGGIGVAVALAVALHLLGPESGGSAARGSATSQVRSWKDADVLVERGGNDARSPTAPDLRRPGEGLGGDDDPAKGSENDPAGKQGGDTNAARSNDDARDTAAANGDGGGGGSANTRVKTPGGSGEKANDPAAGGTVPPPTNNSVATAAGGGTAGEIAGGSGTAGAGGTSAGAAAGKRRPAPVWRSGAWSVDQAAAREAIDAGRVPDVYRDLVRDYFERE